MLGNYLKVAVRHLLRHRLYSLINIAGLAVGMAACILILLLVRDELSYDRHHEKADQIYRVLQGRSARTSYPPGAILRDAVPEVVEMVRLCKWGRLVSYSEKRFEEQDFIYADPNVFAVFTFPLLKGDPQTALAEPFSIVITEEMARKYFGDEDPVGKVLRTDNKHDYTVTGVLEKMPRASHFTFDFLATFVGAEKVFYENMLTHWGVSNFYTYLVLHESSSIPALEEKMSALIAPVIEEKHPELTPPHLVLQPLLDTHLHSANLWGDIEVQGNITWVYVFSAIAAVILLIACINFTNLSTARSVERMREVGMRKVVGACRRHLVGQFMGESVFLTFIALLIGLALVELFLPFFNTLVDKKLGLFAGESRGVLWGLVGIALCVGIAAGSYPALYLSAFRPVEVLEGKVRSGRGGLLFRRGLVLLQFAISIALIAGTGVVYRQMEFMRHKDLGFDKEHVAVVEMSGGDIELFKAEVAQHPGIVSLAGASDVPPDSYFRSAPIIPEGASERTKWARLIVVDYDLIETLGLALVAGRAFSSAFGTDEEEGLILTEAAVAALGWESPEAALGKRCQIDGERTVVGVLKDFHFESLHAPVSPMAFEVRPSSTWLLVVRMRGDRIPETLDFLKGKWAAQFPDWPFDYWFVDQSFDRAYRAEERTGRVAGGAALLTIFVACLGLFGLASFTAEQRTKEIGIRKVLGASVPGIVALLSKEVSWLVIGANAVAWPVAYLAMDRWLQEFAYRIDPGVEIFALGGLLALAIAWLTVGWQAVRAALTNPVEALRYE